MHYTQKVCPFPTLLRRVLFLQVILERSFLATCLCSSLAFPFRYPLSKMCHDLWHILQDRIRNIGSG